MRYLAVIFPIVVAAAFLPPVTGQTNAVFSGDAVSAFQSNVRPLLRANCLACHRQDSRTSGLALDSRTDILAGGNRGPAVKPGQPDASLLIQAIEQKGDLKMPPGK